jgi:hypothetical protein
MLKERLSIWLTEEWITQVGGFEKRALVGKCMRAFQPADHVEGEVANMADRGVDNSGSWGLEKRAGNGSALLFM